MKAAIAVEKYGACPECSTDVVVTWHPSEPCAGPQMEPSVLSNEERGLAGETPWPVTRAVVLLRDEFTCAMCGAFATQVDHIIARCHEGSDHPRNLQAACKPCNQAKGNWLPTQRPEFFRHLTLDALNGVLDEMREIQSRLHGEIRFYRGVINELHEDSALSTAGEALEAHHERILAQMPQEAA